MDISYLWDMAQEAEELQALESLSQRELAIMVMEERKLTMQLNHQIDQLKAELDALRVEILTDLVETAQEVHPDYMCEILEKKLAKATGEIDSF